MPHKFNQSRRHHIKPAKYKVNNWRKYNEALKQRGSLREVVMQQSRVEPL